MHGSPLHESRLLISFFGTHHSLDDQENLFHSLSSLMPSSCFGGAVVKMLIPPLARGDVFIEKYFHEKMHFHVGVAS